MMFRNSDWSRAFLEQLSEYAHLGEEALLQMRPVCIVNHSPRTHVHHHAARKRDTIIANRQAV